MTSTPEGAAAPDARSPRRDAVILAAVGAGYFLAHQLAFLFPDAQQVLMTVWPAGGVGLAALLLAPRRLWPAIAATLFVAGNAANIVSDRSLLASLGFMSANVAESVGCAWLIVALCGERVRFATLREVLALIVGATLVNAVTACLGAATGALVSTATFVSYWKAWFVADGLGILLVTPLVVTWAERLPLTANLRWGRVAESCALVAVWCATAWLIFRAAGASHPDVQPPYLLFALLPWPAYRFGQRGTSLALLAAAALCLSDASVHVGPPTLGGATLPERLLLVQVYLGVLGCTGLLMAASFAETRHATGTARDALDRLRALGDNVPEGMVYQLVREHDGALRFRYVSAGVERIFGVTSADVLGNYVTFFDRIHEDDRDRFRAAQAASIGDLRPVHDVFRIRRPNGQVRWIQVSSAPRRLDDGRLQWDGAIIDITKRLEAEEALRDSEARFRLIAFQLDDVLFITDDATTITYVSPAAERIFGLPPGAMEGHSFTEFVAEADVPKALDSYRQSLATGQTAHGLELAMRRRDSSQFLGELHSSLFQKDGRTGTIGAIRDITDRRRAEEARHALQARLHQAQKIESVGRLAGGIAHDFNNTVQAILLNTEMALADISDGHPLRRYLTDIQTSSQHSADLTAQFLAFARKQPARPLVLDLNAVVAALLPLLRQCVGEDISTAWTPGPGLWHARIDPTQVQQVLTNLALNARDAIAGVGRLSFGTANVAVNAALASAHPDLAPGDYVRLTVADDGCGMDGATLAHIFEPFFTTKPVGAGTGLGLAMVHGIVAQNGGAVTVESAPGRGSTFAVWLPRVEAPHLPPPAQRDAAERPALKRLYMSGYTGDAIGACGALEGDAPLLAKPLPADDVLDRAVRAALDGTPLA